MPQPTPPSFPPRLIALMALGFLCVAGAALAPALWMRVALGVVAMFALLAGLLSTLAGRDAGAGGTMPGERKRPRGPLAVALLVGTSFALSGPEAPAADTSPVAFEHVRVLAMDGTPAHEGWTVVVADGRIQAAGPAGKVAIPKGAERIDGRGRTLLPGLVDMHVHLPPGPAAPGDATSRTLTLLLANGVTTARSMAGHPTHLDVRARLAAGELAGPRLVAAAPALHDKSAPNTKAAAKLVADARAAGYELVKAHHLTDARVWQAAINAAREQGLPVGGHVVSSVGLDRALAAHQQVEHMDGFIGALLPEYAPERSIPFGQVPPPQVLAAVDPARIALLAERIKAGKHDVVPTLALFEGAFGGGDVAAKAARPELRYVPAAEREAWIAQAAQMAGHPELAQVGPAFVALRRDLVRAMAKAGVPLMAGSDSQQDFMVSGFSLHRELDALVAAGLTPMQALETATRHPAAYLARTAPAGTPIAAAPPLGVIAPGAAADLLLVDGAPDRDIAATRRIAGVMRDGRWHDRAALDAMLARVEAGLSPAAGPATADAPANAKPHPVWLVRHAEAGTGDDPPLTGAGAKRADAWHARLGSPQVAVVFVTDTNRSRETGGAIAADAGARVEQYDHANPAALVQRLRTLGAPAVVVAHSNTLPPLAAMLGAPPVPPIGHDEHDRVVRVDLAPATPLAARPGAQPCTLPHLPTTAYCGQVEVPEGGNDPSRMLQVHYSVLPATQAAKYDPLVVLPGGPGLGGKQITAGIAQLFADFNRDRDLVLIDQRGTGESNPLRCELPEDMGAALGSLSETDVQHAIDCRDQLAGRADLSRYTTPLAAQDMERVREALGIARWDLFGTSYGTRPAVEYARQQPGRVGRLVIRAPAPVQMQLPLHTPRDAQDAYDRLARACAGDAACNAAYPDVRGMLDRALAHLDANRVEVTVTDPRNGQPVTAPFDRAALGTSLFFLLYVPELYVHVPRVMGAAAEGDFTPMASSVAPMMLGTLGGIALGHRWSVVCAEDIAPIDPAVIDAVSADTFMGRLAVDSERQACAHWPTAPLPDSYMAPVALDHPTLIIAGTVDPVAPARWGQRMIDNGLRNARLLVVDGAAHMPVLPACTEALVRDFLAGADPHALDATCTEGLHFAPFAVEAAEAAM